MRFVDYLKFALTQLRRNKGRASLTAIGVTVGVFALTTIVALAQGLERAVIEQLTDDESQTLIVVRPGFGPTPERDATVEGVADPVKADRLRKAISKRRRGGPGRMRRKLLRAETLVQLASLEHVTLVRPFMIDRFRLICDEHELDGALSYGIVPESERWNARVIAGQAFREGGRGVWLHEYLLYTWGYRSDAEQAALIGKTVVLSRPRESSGLSGLLDAARAQGIDVPAEAESEAANQMLEMLASRMGKTPDEDASQPELTLELPILGIVRERIEADRFELWEDSFSMQTDVFLPQSLAEELYAQVPANVTRGFNAVAIDVAEVGRVATVEKLLRAEGYRTVSVGTILERVAQTLAVLTAFVSALTAIALLVAVLGIVNTMIMNVSERTREIGVLKALGATDRQVWGLFVIESCLIGLLGGVLGVVLSLLASIPGDAINRALISRSTEYEYYGSVFEYPWWLITLALSFAVILSVLAAWMPATRASRVDPVRALRDE